MAGRNTSKKTHQSKKPGVTQLNPVDWSELERIAGCEFSPDRRMEIIGRLGTIIALREFSETTASNQDLKRTLEFIAKMSPEKAREAYENSDQVTEAYIFAAARLRLGAGPNPTEIPAGLIPQAAALVLLDKKIFPASRGGRPEKTHHKELAEFCAELWTEAGNALTGWTWGKKTAPFLQFSKILFSACKSELSPETIAEYLR